jgi:hypothetical protein
MRQTDVSIIDPSHPWSFPSIPKPSGRFCSAQVEVAPDRWMPGPLDSLVVSAAPRRGIITPACLGKQKASRLGKCGRQTTPRHASNHCHHPSGNNSFWIRKLLQDQPEEVGAGVGGGKIRLLALRRRWSKHLSLYLQPSRVVSLLQFFSEMHHIWALRLL